MRAALCFSGAVSKLGQRFQTANSLYSPGEYVDFRACAESTRRHILSPNPHQFSIFMHCWNQDLEKELTSLYQPKAASFEDNQNYADWINARIKQPQQFAGMSKALSMQKSIDLMLQSGETFDQVIIYRPDVVLFTDLLLSSYDPTKIYCNQFQGNQGDFHFLMNQKHAAQFRNLPNSGIEPREHLWIREFIQVQMGQELLADEILAGRDQEVMRKVQGA